MNMTLNDVLKCIVSNVLIKVEEIHEDTIAIATSSPISETGFPLRSRFIDPRNALLLRIFVNRCSKVGRS